MNSIILSLRERVAAAWVWLSSDDLKRPSNRLFKDEPIDWRRCMPFVAMHLGCLSAIWVGFSATAGVIAAGLFFARMFFITGFYHRYFSHRTFKTSRAMQFVMACLTCTAGQRGPLWWAAHHRHHHNHSDDEPDPHSPHVVGFFRAHMGWFMTESGFATNTQLVRDWVQYPELRWVNRLDWLPLLLLAAGLYALGEILHVTAPQLETSGWQLFVWGWLISTILVYHATYTINSLAHQFGSKRFETGDDSRNNFWLALLTLGEGWHNNHHHYPASTRQGFYWWEIDMTYYLLWMMSKLGLVWDLRPVPKRVLARNRMDGH